MRIRWLVVVLTASLAFNALLLLAWLRALHPAPVATRPVARRPIITNLLRPLRTNLVFQPRLLTWRDIESEDYAGYVRNLRAIGCPEPTVRDIIVADVDEFFAARRVEIPNPRREWWRSDPDPEESREATARRAALDAERRDLLITLLGPGWDTDRLTAVVEEQGNPLDGEVFARLSGEARLQVRQIERRNAARRAEITAAQVEGGPTVGEWERLQRETRAELAAVLDPEQLEEYLLRYSQAADRLRAELRGFDASPDEFRSLFHAQESLAARGESLPAPGAEAATETDLERQREATLERVLGASRYAHYRLNRDPVFQQLRSVAERAGVDAVHLIPLYEVNREVQAERQRLLNDSELSPEAQEQQLAELETVHRAGLRRLLGEDQFRRLQEAGLP